MCYPFQVLDIVIRFIVIDVIDFHLFSGIVRSECFNHNPVNIKPNALSVCFPSQSYGEVSEAVVIVLHDNGPFSNSPKC